MADPHWENLKEIFHAAVALAPAERGAYLDRACDANASLRQSVDSLIKSHDHSFIVMPYVEGETLIFEGRRVGSARLDL
jgi:hypothetical protein